MPTLHLKPGRERSVRRFHPWIFSGAVARIEGEPAPGTIINVHSADDKFLGRGFYNPNSQIVCRMLTWQEEQVDAVFFERKIHAALRLREQLVAHSANAFRVVNAEGDGLPGLIVDKYADFLVVQVSTLGMAQRRAEIVASLQNLLAPIGIYERSAGASLQEEGLQPSVRLLVGEEPPEKIVMHENALCFNVNVREGQKTGFFLDQRENRRWVAQHAKGRAVLNGFCYSGAFSIYAAAAGATRVVSVDSSGPALQLAKENFALNNLPIVTEDFVAADVFHFLRSTTQKFDFIILDPPAFAHRQKDVDNAARAYKDLNLQAFKLLSPGGLLFTCSCSQPLSPDLFQKILFGAAVDAKRAVRLLGHSDHAPDHPINIYHPEGRYLQAFLLGVE